MISEVRTTPTQITKIHNLQKSYHYEKIVIDDLFEVFDLPYGVKVQIIAPPIKRQKQQI